MERTLNLSKMSLLTRKRIRDANGVKNTKQLIAKMRGEGYDVGVRKETQKTRAYLFFGERLNVDIERRNALPRVPSVPTVRRRRLILKGTVDVKRDALDTDTEDAFNRQMMIKCAVFIGRPVAYLQLTIDNVIAISFMIDIVGNNGGTIWWNILKTYIIEGGSEGRNPLFNGTFRLVIDKATAVPSVALQQMYKNGKTQCVIDPLLIKLKTSFENCKTASSKTKYGHIIRRIEQMKTVVGDLGVSDTRLEEIAKIAGMQIIMHNIIGKDIKSFNSKSKQVLHITNTEKNHVDYGFLTMGSDFKSISQEEMDYMVNTKWGLISYDTEKKPISIQTSEGAFAVFNPNHELYKAFSDSIGIKDFKLNAIKYPSLNKFCKSGQIINSTPCALCDEPNNLMDVKCADLSTAYAQHNKSKYYAGFLSKIHQYGIGPFTMQFMKEHLGIYTVEITYCKNKLFNDLGIYSGIQYILPSPELLMMADKGIKFKILSGCWGSSVKFEYSEEMLLDRNYCTWAGKLGTDSEYNKYSFKGDGEWAGHLSSELGDKNVFYFEKEGLIAIKVLKTYNCTAHHILAFITAYTRCNMIELMEKIEGELVKVVLDGVYYRGIVKETNLDWKEKEVITHSGFKQWYEGTDFDTSSWPTINKIHGNCILEGSGGSGKSYSVYEDKSLIDVLTVVPTHHLGAGKHYTTIHKLIGKECQSYKESHKTPSVIFIDELTMIESDWVDTAIDMYPHSMFVIAGDIEGKQWFQCRNGHPEDFSKIWHSNWRVVKYDTDYRALDERLRKFKEEMRKKMREVFTDGNEWDTKAMRSHIINTVDIISMNDAMLEHRDGDIWIRGTHKRGAILKSNNISCEHNGKKDNGFTVHAFQGQTIESAKVFITLDMFEYAMFYTAISRVRHFSQLRFVL